MAIQQTERLKTANTIVQFPQQPGGDRRRRAIHATSTCKVLQLPSPQPTPSPAPAPSNDNSDRAAIVMVAFVLAVIIAAIGAASVIDLKHTQDCFPASQCKQASFLSF